MKALRLLGFAIVGVLVLVLLVAGVALALFDGERVKGELTQHMREQKQRTLTMDGTPQLSLWPNIGVSVQGVTLSEPASATAFVSVKSARVSVALLPLLSRQVQVKGLDVDGLELSVIKAKDGSMNYANLLASPAQSAPNPTVPSSEPATLLQLDIAGINLTQAKLTWRNLQTDSTVVVNNLGLRTGRVQADATKKTMSVTELLLSADATNPTSQAQAQLTLTDLQGTDDALQVASLILKLDAKSGADTLTARLSSPVAINLSAQTVGLPKLEGQLELASPRMPMKQLRLPLSGNLQVDAARQTAAVDLATQLDASKLALKLTAASFAPLALAFDLDVNQLNVDTYLPPPATKAETSTPPKDTPLDFAALKGPNVRGKVRIGALQVAGIRLEQLNASLSLNDGRLAVAPLTMRLYQGAASGSLTLNATGNQIALQQTLADISINPLMQDVLKKDLLEGRGTVQLDIKGQGTTVAALKKSLSGNAALRLKDGALKGINLAKTVRDLKVKLGVQQDTTQQAQAGEKTDFSELSASFTLANGVAHNEDLVMKSPFLRLGGAGNFDIGAGQMNYVAKASVVGSAEGQGGKGLDQMKGLTLPVRVSGPFDNLSYKLEFGSMINDAAKAGLEEKKQEVKRQLEDKAKDLFKGLLGR